jgi:hypothetical protein
MPEYGPCFGKYIRTIQNSVMVDASGAVWGGNWGCRIAVWCGYFGRHVLGEHVPRGSRGESCQWLTVGMAWIATADCHPKAPESRIGLRISGRSAAGQRAPGLARSVALPYKSLRSLRDQFAL